MKKLIYLQMSLLLLTGCVSVKPLLGINNAKLKECPNTPNCVSSMTDDPAYYIEPIIITGTQKEIKKEIISVVNSLENTNIIISEDNYIRVEVHSNFFHFIDDVEFYFPETKSEDIVIHVRSASRVGYSDLGVNRERIELIRSKL